LTIAGVKECGWVSELCYLAVVAGVRLEAFQAVLSVYYSQTCGSWLAWKDQGRHVTATWVLYFIFCIPEQYIGAWVFYQREAKI